MDVTEQTFERDVIEASGARPGAGRLLGAVVRALPCARAGA